ncbi:uncharacterized protein LOC128450330 isoform X3 [Pleuronectes platessa]|uniref:uncharacterized protein LOC128450330 isoform X3 n=1 Tax=Pleuronectes platessa TaxID=8262 RepID=UPI00232A50E6|nr:uncharacterized protein LOC128450330 isoform X3 [Pleuronectes platessa]
MARRFKGKPGDLLEIFRGSYQHWAVYIGGQEVVHLVTDGGQSSGSSANPSSRAEVKREKLTDVVGNDSYQLNNLLDDSRTAREPNVIVKEAFEMVDHKLPYNLYNKNSEDFAIEMRYGKAESCQFNGKPGDLIEIFRGQYKDWAIYIGEDEVVHLVTDVSSIKHTGGDSSCSLELLSSRAEVKREKLTDVVGNDSYQVNNLLDDSRTAREPNVIVKEARAMVDHKLPYNLYNKNSEHFAIEMRYGKAESCQFKGNKGDLIEIFRGSYKHWAVYIGGNEVVHLVTDGGLSFGSLASLSSRAEVKREKLTDVVGHDRFKVNNLLDDRRTAREPNVIVKEARAMVDHKLPYNLDNKNSEHFATDLRYGVAESCQFNGKPGDLIEIFRGPYKDWAVYISKDEVVHFTTDGRQSSGSSASLSSSRGKVKCEKFTDVVGSDRYQINNLLDDLYDARDTSIMVKEASAMVGRNPQYNLVTYNSEHFASEMRYGKAKSRQFKGKPGDLIEIFRGHYKHWAIYIGKDEVVHFGTDSSGSSGLFKSLSRSAGTVKREKLTDVAGNDRYKVNNLLDEEYEARDPSIIVDEACAFVSHKLWYSVVKFNCEHFATEMRYGKALSQQVRKAFIKGAKDLGASAASASSSSK